VIVVVLSGPLAEIATALATVREKVWVAGPRGRYHYRRSCPGLRQSPGKLRQIELEAAARTRRACGTCST
jgi:hypothetical protein